MIPLLAVVAQATLDRTVSLDRELPYLAKEGRVRLEGLRGKANLVLLFLNEQCSVTYYYKGRLQRLVSDFEPKGFRFVVVRTGRKQYPDRPVRLPESDYLKVPFLEDEGSALMSSFGVGQSLTFAVIDRERRLRYLGGLDDHVNPTLARRTPLRDALSAIASGRPVKVKRFETLGCAILPVGTP